MVQPLQPRASLDVARELRAAGLSWVPARGDHFVVPDRNMDDDVFVLSDMTIEVHDFATGPVIGFNGTTEWALDSLDQHAALWLPTEGQLRTLLGATLRRLERTGPRTSSRWSWTPRTASARRRRRRHRTPTPARCSTWCPSASCSPPRPRGERRR
jgi:hypothetical protein